jgi:hypothetical protein
MKTQTIRRMVKVKTNGSLAQSAEPHCGPAVEDEIVPWPRENLPTGAGPWRRTTLNAGNGGGHATATTAVVDHSVVPTLPYAHQHCWIRLADSQLPLAPLQAILALLRATWAPLQTRWRLLQAT